MMLHWQKLTFQLTVIVLLAFAFVYGLVVVDAFGRENGLPDMRVLMTVVFTSVIFVAVVAEFRRSWRNWRLWLAIATLFGLHVLACASLWKLGVEWPVIVYGRLRWPRFLCCV
jgi:hypothetical protein